MPRDEFYRRIQDTTLPMPGFLLEGMYVFHTPVVTTLEIPATASTPPLQLRIRIRRIHPQNNTCEFIEQDGDKKNTGWANLSQIPAEMLQRINDQMKKVHQSDAQAPAVCCGGEEPLALGERIPITLCTANKGSTSLSPTKMMRQVLTTPPPVVEIRKKGGEEGKDIVVKGALTFVDPMSSECVVQFPDSKSSLLRTRIVAFSEVVPPVIAEGGDTTVVIPEEEEPKIE